MRKIKYVENKCLFWFACKTAPETGPNRLLAALARADEINKCPSTFF